VFAAAFTATEPFPVPAAPEVIDSHDAPLVAVHAHPFATVTANDPTAPPLAPIDTVVGFTEDGHVAEAAAWVMVTVCPAIVSVPVREAPLLEATLNVTVPAPLPLVRPVTEIHAMLLLAVHSHPALAVTDTDSPSVTAAETEMVRGETV
jgi:hypothetical protein